MTPAQEAAYAVDWGLPRDDLDPAVQREYDRLQMEREAQPQVRAPAPREAETPAWQYLIPFFVLWVAWMIWATAGTYITGSHMNFTTLRSDISKIQLPAGYEKKSTSESGSDRGCAEKPCKLREFWVWRGSSVHTAADACRDTSRAMAARLGGVDSDAPIPQGAACGYFTVLDNFFQPGLGKREVEGLVWVNDKAKGSPGGYILELVAGYDYVGY